MKPFLFNEVFAVNANLAVRDAGVPSVPAVVIDGFLSRPREARAVVGEAPAANWKHVDGGRNFVDYYDCRLRFPVWLPNHMLSVAQQAVETVYSAKTLPQEPGVDVNWFMQIREKRGDFAIPHQDISDGRRSYTCLVYLNSAEECSGGTAFFRFRKSNALALDEAYAAAVRDEAGVVESGRDYWPENPARHWEMVGSVAMVPGRLLIFPSEYFHAAWHPENGFYAFPRLTMAFWMVR